MTIFVNLRELVLDMDYYSAPTFSLEVDYDVVNIGLVCDSDLAGDEPNL